MMIAAACCVASLLIIYTLIGIFCTIKGFIKSQRREK
jgi:hypothetical protein